MKIAVCIRRGLDGEINPFDACAYEEALRIKDAEITLISMGPEDTRDFLLGLTRLGAEKAILLTDKAFAGADTVATAYTLSLAIKRLKPDLIFCGRQALVGDTAQTGPMLSVFAGAELITNVMGIEKIGEAVTCTTRSEGVQAASLPALLTIERINSLRLPSIMSRPGTVEVLSAEDIGADPKCCGLAGSPTRVLKTFENQSGKRKCKFISFEELPLAIEAALKKNGERTASVSVADKRLEKVCIVGEAPRAFAKTVSDDIILLKLGTAEELSDEIERIKPSAVLWGSDDASKKLAAQVSARLRLGLCADCTSLETDGSELIMYRPALSGSIIAKIKSLTRPAMATVRTADSGVKNIIVGIGYGARNNIEAVKSFASELGADIAATRKAVDNGYMPYSSQVGLTGKTVTPPVYIAVGVSGAVHHLVGMQSAGTVIAINPDKDAPIFQYADFGILREF